jgi:hypothetical protein
LLTRREDENPAAQAKTTRSPHAVALFPHLFGRRLALVDPRLDVKVKSEQSKPDVVHISIEDTGTGIDPSNLEQVFSPLRARKVSGPQISGIRENSSFQRANS